MRKYKILTCGWITKHVNSENYANIQKYSKRVFYLAILVDIQTCLFFKQ